MRTRGSSIALVLTIGALFYAGLFQPLHTHRHRCRKCKCVWEHNPMNRLSTDAHKCPECGTERRLIYSYPLAPTYHRQWGETTSLTEGRFR